MKHHVSTCIEGLLSLPDYRLKKMLPDIKRDGIPFQTVGQLRKVLHVELELGHRLLPAEGCTNFDPVKGCLGCPSPDYDPVDKTIETIKSQLPGLCQVPKSILFPESTMNNERDKVISAIENCIAIPKCRDCPWDECEEQHETVELPLGLAKEALRFLKAHKLEV